MADTTNTLKLTPGTRLRTGGKSYEVTKTASVAAGIVLYVPQKTRLLKVYCETCKYTCRITNRWIEKAGTPLCPSGHGRMTVQVKADDKLLPVEIPVSYKAEPEPPIEPDDYEPEEPKEPPIALTPEPEPEPEPDVDTPSTLAGLLADL